MPAPAMGVVEPAPAELFDTALRMVAVGLRDDCDPDCSLTLHEWETRGTFVALLDRPLALRMLIRVADVYAADPELRAALAAPLHDGPATEEPPTST